MSFSEDLDTIISEKGIDLDQAFEVEGPNKTLWRCPLWILYRNFNQFPENQQYQLWEEWMSIGFFELTGNPPGWDDLDSVGCDPSDFEGEQEGMFAYWLDTRKILAAEWVDFLLFLVKLGLWEDEVQHESHH